MQISGLKGLTEVLSFIHVAKKKYAVPLPDEHWYLKGNNPCLWLHARRYMQVFVSEFQGSGKMNFGKTKDICLFR